MTTIDEARARLLHLRDDDSAPLTALDVEAIDTLLSSYDEMKGRIEEAVRLMEPFAEVSKAYFRNELDEARPFNGDNSRDPATIEMVSGRGGKRLVTLWDCHNAASFISREKVDGGARG